MGDNFEAELNELSEKLKDLTDRMREADKNGKQSIDQRWLAIGVTDLQKGFMSVRRSIFFRSATF